MNILLIQESKERSRVKAMCAFAAATHWTWYFYYLHFFPNIKDFLWNRIALCIYCFGLVIVFSKNPEKSISKVRYLFNLGLFLFLANEALLVYSNPTQTLTLFTFFGMGLITATSVLKFKDFFIFAVFSLLTPLTLHLIKPSFEFMFLVHWTTFATTVMSVVGYLVYSNFSNKSEVQMSHLSSIQNAKMAALGEMASGMAHEINNPLAIIKGKTEQLIRKIRSTAYDEKDLYVSDLLKIEMTAERIAKIIKSLKAFSRNSQHDVLVDVSLSGCIESTLELCHEKIINEKIKLKIETVPKSWVIGKESEISQILLNLISNSIDAIANQVEKEIKIEFETDSETTLIKVIDSGPPISSEIKAKLMEPFFTTKEVGKGTGLGLSISKGLAESFGGALYLLPQFERTCFVLKLKTSKTPVESALN